MTATCKSAISYEEYLLIKMEEHFRFQCTEKKGIKKLEILDEPINHSRPITQTPVAMVLNKMK